MKRGFIVVFFNDWGNEVVIFKGSQTECENWYDKHIEKREELDAIITKA